jgi:hypothetical protein
VNDEEIYHCSYIVGLSWSMDAASVEVPHIEVDGPTPTMKAGNEFWMDTEHL